MRAPPQSEWATRARRAVRTLTTPLRTSAWLQVAAMATTAASVVVLASALAVAGHAGSLVHQWSRALSWVVLLPASVEVDGLTALAEEVSRWPEVSRVRIHPRAALLDELRAALGPDGALIDAEDEDLLGGGLELWAEPTTEGGRASPASRAALHERLRAHPVLGRATTIDDASDLLDRASAARDALRWSSAALCGLAALAVILVVSNTIRLGLLARQEELTVRLLVGATEASVRAPFLLEGVVQAGLGAGLGLLAGRLLHDLALQGGALPALLRAGLGAAPGGAAGVDALAGSSWALGTAPPYLAFSTQAIIVAAAAGVGALAAAVATARHLRA